jgi:NAD(P)-dependent dehydrogenase (short-subunit alcohol dehydrogenase family)
MTTTTHHAIYPSIRNKNVLITGGAEGIGASAVELFALQGAQVIILDISTSSAETLIARIKTLTDPITGNPVPTPIFHQSDVADLPKLQSLAQEILQTHKIIHVLINNAASAGSLARKDTMSMTPESWDFNMNVNLRHMFFLTQAFVPAMQAAGGGSVVNMGSITWRIPAVGLPAYTTIKAAIMGLTRTHSKEFGPWGIRVNSVMPGAIATERQIKEVLTDEYRAEVMAAQSLKRDLMPMEVAKVIVFLASDEASAVTGSSYVVDGGWCGDP